MFNFKTTTEKMIEESLNELTIPMLERRLKNAIEDATEAIAQAKVDDEANFRIKMIKSTLREIEKMQVAAKAAGIENPADSINGLWDQLPDVPKPDTSIGGYVSSATDIVGRVFHKVKAVSAASYNAAKTEIVGDKEEK